MSKITQDLQKLSEKELGQKVAELRKELAEQKRARAAGELLDFQAVKKTRRTIAASLTLLKLAANAPKKEES